MWFTSTGEEGIIGKINKGKSPLLAVICKPSFCDGKQNVIGYDFHLCMLVVYSHLPHFLHTKYP